MSKTKRYDAIDGLRALSCIGIMAGHILTNAKYDVSGFLLGKMIPSCFNLVFLFMAISAFGMCCGYYERMLTQKIDIVDFYKKRYIKILPFFALLCLLDLINSPSLNSLYEVFANLTLCFGLIPNADITVIGVGWFLGTVFVFYLIFPFFCFLLSDKRRAWFAFVASYLMNLLCRFYFDASRESIAYSFVYFMVGGLVFVYKDKLIGSKIKYISLTALIVTLVIYYMTEPYAILLVLISSLFLIYSLSVSSKGVLINRFTKFIGGISFEIYLCHMLVFRVVEKAKLLRLTSNDYINYFIVLTFVFAGAVLVAVIGQKFINKLFEIFNRNGGVNGSQREKRCLG